MKVYPTMLLKTNVEKMSVWGYATMSMKRKGLFLYSHDMYEKKGASLKPQVENGDRGVRPRPLWICAVGRFIHPAEG